MGFPAPALHPYFGAAPHTHPGTPTAELPGPACLRDGGGTIWPQTEEGWPRTERGRCCRASVSPAGGGAVGLRSSHSPHPKQPGPEGGHKDAPRVVSPQKRLQGQLGGEHPPSPAALAPPPRAGRKPGDEEMEAVRLGLGTGIPGEDGPSHQGMGNPSSPPKKRKSSGSCSFGVFGEKGRAGASTVPQWGCRLGRAGRWEKHFQAAFTHPGLFLPLSVSSKFPGKGESCRSSPDPLQPGHPPRSRGRSGRGGAVWQTAVS